MTSSSLHQGPIEQNVQMNTYFTFPHIARARVQFNAHFFFYCFNFVVLQILKNVVSEILR